MPVNGMSTGKDYNFGFYDGNSSLLVPLGDVQSIKVSAMKHQIVSRPYNGNPRFGFIPDGYGFAFNIVRTGPELEDFQLQANTNFEAGVSLKAGYLNETIYEDDGSVSRYQYPGFVIWIDELGEVTREGVIKMTCEGKASSKKRLL